MTYGNGLILNQDYDLDYRLTLKQVGTVYDRTINYNDVDNITSITNNLDTSRNQTFGYDDLDRLTDAASTGSYGSQYFEYDNDGNRTLETLNGSTSNYAYSTTANQLDNMTGANANSFSYDNNGNTQTKSGMTFSFDNTNRMSQAVNGVTTANYKYDGKGQRVSKEVNGVTTLFIFDKDGKLIAEADGAGQTQREYIYFSGQPVALAKYGTGAGVYYYHTNHLGTPQLLTDQSQAVVWSGDYDPFGKVNITTSTVENLLRQPGQFEDLETGLYLNGFRDYDPSLGRYAESDPIGLMGGRNTYIYGDSSPIMYSDYFGLYPSCKQFPRKPIVNKSRYGQKSDEFVTYGMNVILVGPSVGPNLDPNNPRRSPLGIGMTWEYWWAKKAWWTQETWEKITTTEQYYEYCKETRTDECGNEFELKWDGLKSGDSTSTENMIDSERMTRIINLYLMARF